MKVRVTAGQAIENVKSAIQNENLTCRWAQCQCGDVNCQAAELFDNKDRKLGMADYGYSIHVVTVIGEPYDVYVGDGAERELEALLGLPECPNGLPPWSDVLKCRRGQERQDEVYAMGYGKDGAKVVEDLRMRQHKIDHERYLIHDLRRQSNRWFKRADKKA